MKKIEQVIFNTFVILFCAGALLTLSAQNRVNQSTIGDSLSLNDIIQQVIKTYPTIKDAEEALQTADAKISLAKTGYYPDIFAQASYTRIGPVPAFDLPGLGSLELAPRNNYNAEVVLKQRLFDFGKVSGETEYEKENKNLVVMSVEQVKQKLSLTAINNYYALVYLQEAIDIKNEQLKTLNEHLNFIQKKEQTGSATQYEILSTKVKISGVESQKLDLEAAYKTQLSVLNSLLSEPEHTVHQLQKASGTVNTTMPDASLVSYALSNRDEIKIAKEKEKLAGLHYDVVNNQNDPVIDVYGSAGAKNGYEPDIFKITANFAAGVEIKVPIFDAMRNHNSLLIASSGIKSSAYQTQAAGKSVTTEVVESEANLNAAKKKVDQFQIQLAQAQKALSLAEVSFKAGAITNLDLLDATTALSESKLYLLKAGIEYQINAYKLKAAIGDRLY